MMNKRHSDTFLLIVWLLLLVVMEACGNAGKDRNQEAVEALVAEKVEERLASYRETIMRQCRERILEEAGRKADSILIVEARLERDTLNRPPRPMKPERPEIRPPGDTATVRPFFSDTLGRR